MASDDTYLLGRSAAEIKRLARQAALIERETEDLFRSSGITAGMNVLEIGSGAGDVAMLVGRLVRPDGTVLGIERSADSVALATQRALGVADGAVRFEVGDLNSYAPTGAYDALVGRFVLPYLADPAGTLRRLAAHVRPGGIIAFMEFDVRQISTTPEAPLFRTVAGWIVGSYERSGVDPSLGSSLGAVFRDAGLQWPYMSSFQKTSCGSNGIIWYFAELVRTLLPQIVQSGLATADEVNIDSLEARLQAEAVATRVTAFSPRWVGAWVRQPELR